MMKINKLLDSSIRHCYSTERLLSVMMVLVIILGVTACGGGGGGGGGGEQIPEPVLSEEPPPPADPLELKQSLGSLIFFDTNLSTPPGQSCATCHDPDAGFADPDSRFPVSQGVHEDRFGNRNTPTVTYAALTPEFRMNNGKDFIGGQFLDGRAANLAEQAKQPFLNPLEMANSDKLAVVVPRCSKRCTGKGVSMTSKLPMTRLRMRLPPSRGRTRSARSHQSLTPSWRDRSY
jgi:hypothetical protein